MTKKTLLFTLVLAPLFALSLSAVTVWFMFQTKFAGPDSAFTVYPGDTFGQVNTRLYQNKVISNTRLFHWLARYRGDLEKLRAGAYPIPTGSTMPQVLDILVHGQPLLVGVTIPEGKNMYEVATLLGKGMLADPEAFLKYVKDPEVVKSFGLEAPSLEGYLYPETYRFAPGTSLKEIVGTMVGQFRAKTQGKLEGHPFLTPHQVVILASIVEKETGAKVERPQIASVFTNRLVKHMRLQSDPTTIYGIWERYTGNIHKEDLLAYSDYNTYKIPALPLGPISNPSLEAIEAVMHPAQTENLFFVSKNDGTHVFTKTFAEHNAAVDEWQRKRSNRDGKSWRQLKQ